MIDLWHEESQEGEKFPNIILDWSPTQQKPPLGVQIPEIGIPRGLRVFDAMGLIFRAGIVRKEKEGGRET
jgi:hypothetical protein